MKHKKLKPILIDLHDALEKDLNKNGLKKRQYEIEMDSTPTKTEDYHKRCCYTKSYRCFN